MDHKAVDFMAKHLTVCRTVWYTGQSMDVHVLLLIAAVYVVFCPRSFKSLH